MSASAQNSWVANDVRLQSAREADLEQVHLLAQRIWPVCYAGILSAEQISNMLERIYGVEALRQQLREGQEFWLLHLEGRPAGYASVVSGGDNILLKKLYLLPELQGRGLGKRMLESLFSLYPQARQVSLYVNRDNHPAQAFYRKMGFSLSGSEAVRMGDFDFVDLIFTRNL